MRTIFLKRMESSVVALTSTVSNMIEYFDLFLKELTDRDRVITPKDAQRLRAVLGGSLSDDALDDDRSEKHLRKRGGELPAAPIDLAQRARLVEDVEQDREALSLLLRELKANEAQWNQREDPKLVALRNLLETLPPFDKHGVRTKAVIFTNYKDTADYLFTRLGGTETNGSERPRRWRSNLSDGRWLSKLTGEDKRERRNDVLQYFAPLAFNRETELPDDPILLDKIKPFRDEGIELLIATDVLSEGQNLQDAQYLINYDLHWNPVKMIQRAGRIDRLFSPHDRIFIYNVMPEQELESLLKLVSSLADKVASIDDMVGLDASVLGEQIESKAFDKIMKLAAGGKQADDVYREGEQSQGFEDAFAELNTYVQMVKDLGTEDVKSVPDGVFSIRIGREPGTFIMLRMPEDASGQVFWRFYPAANPQPKITPSAVIKLIETTSEEDRAPFPKETSPFAYLEGPLRAAIDQIGEEYKQHVHEKTSDEFTKKLARILGRDDVLLADPELFEHLSDWAAIAPPTTMLNRPRVIDAVRAIRQSITSLTLSDAIDRLRALWDGLRAEGLDRPIARPPSREPRVQDLQLVCWELVVTPEMLGVAGLPKPELWGALPLKTARLQL
jgi:hypothetical protein